MKAHFTILVAVSLSVMACRNKGGSPGDSTKVPDRALEPVEVINVERPVLGTSPWGDSAAVVTYKITLFQKPPYYPGDTPVHYLSMKLPNQHLNIVVAHGFDSWSNNYVYADSTYFAGIAAGAQAIDKEGNLLAEARLLNIADTAFEIEEFHYWHDKVRFYCKSIFTRRGTKQSESGMLGKKEQDYFFIWPGGY